MEYTHQRGETRSRVPRDPRFEFVVRPAGRLACGDLAREPVLGIARITGVTRADQYVHLIWADEHGPCTAAGRYPVGQPFPVRAPHPVDRVKIEGAIQRATWAKQAVQGNIARLIAAHLNRGAGTALRAFAADGAVTDPVYEELEQVDADQPHLRPWAHALVQYCLDREYQGPMSGWGPWEQGPQPPLGRRLAPLPLRRGRKGTDVMSKKRMPTETAQQLIDAAFTMGLAASRSPAVAAKAKWILRQHITGGL